MNMAAFKSHHTEENKVDEPLAFTLDLNISQSIHEKLDEMK